MGSQKMGMAKQQQYIVIFLVMAKSKPSDVPVMSNGTHPPDLPSWEGCFYMEWDGWKAGYWNLQSRKAQPQN